MSSTVMGFRKIRRMPQISLRFLCFPRFIAVSFIWGFCLPFLIVSGLLASDGIDVAV
jgi:hypothetical protein